MSLPLDYSTDNHEMFKPKTYNPYPYLKILEDICTHIKSKDNPCVQFGIGDEHSKFHTCGNSLLLAYPYANLLQKLIQSAELDSSEDLENKDNLDENLRYIMRTLHFDVQLPSNSCNEILQLNSNEILRYNSYDMTYTSKLKHVASLSETMDCNYSNFTSNLNEINEAKFSLKNMCPIKIENSETLVYSEKLKTICEQLKEDTNLRDALSYQYYEDNSGLLNDKIDPLHINIKCENERLNINESHMFDLSDPLHLNVKCKNERPNVNESEILDLSDTLHLNVKCKNERSNVNESEKLDLSDPLHLNVQCKNQRLNISESEKLYLSDPLHLNVECKNQRPNLNESEMLDLSDPLHLNVKCKNERPDVNESEILDLSNYQSSSASRSQQKLEIFTGQSTSIGKTEGTIKQKFTGLPSSVKCTSNQKLFEALMENVNYQSIQCVENVSEERPLDVDDEPILGFDPSKLGEVSIKRIERKLTKHINS